MTTLFLLDGSGCKGQLDKKRTFVQSRKPKEDKIQAAEKVVDGFDSYEHGKVVLLNISNSNEVIAVIKFTPIKNLTPAEKEGINFVTKFLHQSKKFVNPVGPSRSWAGRMWAVGWRKCMKALEVLGRYMKLPAVHKSPIEYSSVVKTSTKVSNILGGLFSAFANIPFNANRVMMQNNKIPSFDSPEFNDELLEFQCAPHITFTSHGFFNHSHADKNDASEYAFAMFVPTKKKDGTLADPSTGYDVSGGRLVFPDYCLCINFKQRGIVKLVWAAKAVRHCTMPAIESKLFTRMEMSLQIPKKTSRICRDIKNGLIYIRKAGISKKHVHFGGHRFYMKNTKIAKKTSNR
ncbi:hypothetical protein PGTUg99_001566 [Puccinia graminis f. sp. tritici]|uniref:Tet-like 2OG-Fe(II) oxygenase domain-containing protein n=1 Tax=Puccinia graminis f. sp. tritici TaxID=56615 RepID=A0A5B0P9Q4_PUCGR|nr:hypothetical protein PGTUg99_001566 [Puccinia graminis f. sp. tritici]